jgi:hypothetical protein
MHADLDGGRPCTGHGCCVVMPWQAVHHRGPTGQVVEACITTTIPELIPVRLRSLSRARCRGKPLARKPATVDSPALSSTELHPPRPRSAVTRGAWSFYRFHLYRGELFGTASPWSTLRLGRHGRRALPLCDRSLFLPHS